MRNAIIKRTTSETDIAIELSLDGRGVYDIATGAGFLDHMLCLFARHGRFDLKVHCKGDTYVDYHHTTEDIGIALGAAFREALGDMRGIMRYGEVTLPMDEALVQTALDISGRGMLTSSLSFPTQKMGDFDTELITEFFEGFSRSFGITLHIRMLAGSNSHHIAEAAFKGFARALAHAVAIDTRFSDEIPSTKGMLI